MTTKRHWCAAIGAVLFSAGLLLGAALLRPDQDPSRVASVFANRLTPVAMLHPRQQSSPQETAGGQSEPTDYEPLFEGWDDPVLALFISGRQHGYIEPCGCTGLDRQKGGLLRRHTLQKQIMDKGWNVVSIDAGNQVKRFGKQAHLKLSTTYQCLCSTMNYQAIGFGPDDLKVPVIEMLQIMANHGGSDNPFVSANVILFSPEFTHRYRVIEVAGKRIGITAVIGDEHLTQLPPSSDLRTQAADSALREVIPQLTRENCDVTVLISHTSLEQSRQLAGDHPAFDIVITTGGSGEPTLYPEKIPAPRSNHVTQMVQVGVKGMYVGVVGIFPGAAHPIRYQRIPLDARFEDSPEIKEKFLNYQNQLQTIGLQGLGLSPTRHPSDREYVGSETCADCHDTAFDIWENGVEGSGDEVGPHARATLDLLEPTERVWVKRHYDPECLSCHVTGWNPQKYFPYETGYLELGHEHLHGNGCENCHGPGSKHVAAENGDIDVDEATRVQFYKEMIVTLEQAKQQLCFECHDLDNSPDFHEDDAFEKYWARIAHDEDE